MSEESVSRAKPSTSNEHESGHEMLLFGKSDSDYLRLITEEIGLEEHANEAAGVKIVKWSSLAPSVGDYTSFKVHM